MAAASTAAALIAAMACAETPAADAFFDAARAASASAGLAADTIAAKAFAAADSPLGVAFLDDARRSAAADVNGSNPFTAAASRAATWPALAPRA